LYIELRHIKFNKALDSVKCWEFIQEMSALQEGVDCRKGVHARL